MRKVNLLDCTLRDGGYVNNWQFGEDAIKGIVNKLSQTGIEMIEAGFLKGDSYDVNRSLFPDVSSFTHVLQSKHSDIMYVGMLDMSAPVPRERIPRFDGSSIDGIRVIFKKSKMNEAYDYCRYIKEQGYKLFVNFVSTDQYSDGEFISGLEKFSKLHPFGVTIVDTFGMIKRKDFIRLVMLADNNLAEDILLCYHAHNNLQQASENAQAMVEMNLRRDIVIDACVFGMGRGAGNLNLELFAGFMNENYGTNYQIAPMLEIMDEYLDGFYKTKFWGYSLPLYLSASLGCHPNYAIFLAEKQTLSARALREIFQLIPEEEKAIFKKEVAEKYYRQYLENYVDDRECLAGLRNELAGKDVLVLAPGKSLTSNKEKIKNVIEKSNKIVIAIHFYDSDFPIDYIFSSNMRRFTKLPANKPCKMIVTSNLQDNHTADYVMNFSSYISSDDSVLDNAGLMLLRILQAAGVQNVSLAGMDGYVEDGRNTYFEGNDSRHSIDYAKRNRMISMELEKMQKKMNIEFLTDTLYTIRQNER